MKINYFLFIILSYSFHGYTQTQKQFVDKYGQVVDSTKAIGYRISTKEKGLWNFKDLTWENVLMAQGTFIDEALSIKNGPYEKYNVIRKYDDGEYYRDSFGSDSKYYPSVSSFLTEKGVFKKNKQVGIWKGYAESGVLVWTKTYVDGKATGRIQTFDQNGTLVSEGMLENGIPDGDSFKSYLPKQEKVALTDEQKLELKEEEKQRKELQRDFEKFYKEPRLPIDFERKFYAFLLNEYSYARQLTNGYATVEVGSDGVVTKPDVVGVDDPGMKQAIEQFFLKSGKWSAATAGKDKTPVASRYKFSIRF